MVGSAVTVAVAAPEVADTQFTPLEGAVAYAVTDLVPVVAPLTVNVTLPAPLAVPVEAPVQVYVALVPPPEAVNTTFVPTHTVPEPVRVTVGVAGSAVTVAVAAPEVADMQFTPFDGAVAYAVTDLVPVVAPLTV
jgi:hypothetical protein